MRTTVALMTAFTLLAGAVSRAASLQVVSHGSRTFSVYLNGGPDNGAFNAVTFAARQNEPINVKLANPSGQLIQELTVASFDIPVHSPFANVGTIGIGAPRLPGQPFTYINGLLNADPLDFPDGLGWSMLGIIRTNERIEFTGGPLGQTISTANQPGGNLLLANLHYAVPEPATCGLAGMSMLGLAVLSRRS